METIREHLEAAARKAGSFNRLAAHLKTSSANLTRLTLGAGHPGDETVIRLAAYLGEDPKKLLLQNQAERAPEGARGQWETIAKKYAGAACLIFCFSAAYFFSDFNGGYFTSGTVSKASPKTMYIMLNVGMIFITALKISRPDPIR